MTPAALRRIALALPEAHEAPHFDRTSFRVGTKIFATMTKGGDEAMVRVAPMSRIHALLASDPDVFFSYGAWTTKNGALGVRLREVDASTMRALVRDAWRGVAPKMLLAVHDVRRVRHRDSGATPRSRAIANRPKK
jgi:hypothetical protein